jgi:hypothetical protein
MVHRQCGAVARFRLGADGRRIWMNFRSRLEPDMRRAAK